MSVYFFVWFAVALIAVLGRNKKTIGGKDGDTVFFLFLVLFMLSALRYDVGMDYPNYMGIYYNTNRKGSETGFYFLNGLFYDMGLSFQSIVILYGFVTLFFAFEYFKENSKNIYLSVLIFYCFTPLYLGTFNALRQDTAMYVILWATRYIKQRKMLKFILIVFVMVFFAHLSAIMLLPMCFLDKRITFKIGLLLCVAAIIGYRFLDIFIGMTKYAIYLAFIPSTRFPPMYLVEFGFDTLILLFYKGKDEKHFVNKNLAFAHFIIIVMLITNRSSPVNVALDRIALYFLPAQIVMLPNTFADLKKCRLVCNYFVMGCLSGVFILSVYLRGVKNHLVPYQTFFGKF